MLVHKLFQLKVRPLFIDFYDLLVVQQSNVSKMHRVCRSFGHRQYSTGESIPVEKQTMQVFFNNTFPILKVFGFNIPVKSYANQLQQNLSTQFIPSKTGISVKRTVPNMKEGGIFAKLEIEPETDAGSVVRQINEHLKTNKVISVYNFMPVKAFQVKGSPFIEDMVGHLPERTLRVEFEGADVHLETLYSEFREFGRILEIRPLSQSSKDLPRYAKIKYHFVRHAAAARNCLHASKLENTRMQVV